MAAAHAGHCQPVCAIGDASAQGRINEECANLGGHRPLGNSEKIKILFKLYLILI
jgi:hypothetical protein